MKNIFKWRAISPNKTNNLLNGESGNPSCSIPCVKKAIKKELATSIFKKRNNALLNALVLALNDIDKITHSY